MKEKSREMIGFENICKINFVYMHTIGVARTERITRRATHSHSTSSIVDGYFL